MKRHRLERVDEFTGLIHRFDLLLKPARRTHRAELAGGVYEDRDGVCVCSCNSTNAADKAAVAHIRAIRADSNNIIGRGNAETGSRPQGRVVAAGRIAFEGVKAVGCVLTATSVTQERGSSVSRVVAADHVANERISTVGRVLIAGGVVKERSNAGGCVGRASGVAKEGEYSIGGILGAAGVAQKRPGANGGVVVCGVRKERPSADRCVEAPGSVAPERKITDCRVETAGGKT